MASFAEAIAVKALGSHSYSANFPEDWCIGSVPHGGFVTSCFLSATALHFSTTHRGRDQPHTITLHLTFLRRTSVGPALFTIKDIKLGRRTSTVHVSLTQGPALALSASSDPSVVGYLTQSNLDTEHGITLSTNWSLHPAPLPLKSTAALLPHGADPNWIAAPSKHPFFRKAGTKVEWYFPRQGRQLAPAMADEWIRFSQPAGGARFTQLALGYVVDTFPQVVELYPEGELRAGYEAAGLGEEAGRRGLSWYPTVLLNLEVKKALPADGVEWLFVRVRAKRIVKGRMDLEVVVLEEDGSLVAVSQHVCLIVPAERNLAGREQRRKEVGEKNKL